MENLYPPTVEDENEREREREETIMLAIYKITNYKHTINVALTPKNNPIDDEIEWKGFNKKKMATL